MGKELSNWSKEVRKKLIDKDMTISELAKQIGKSRSYVTEIISGRVKSPNTQKLINEFLEI